MFGWFKTLTSSSSSDLVSMSSVFGGMLDDGRQIFLTAANALLGGTDPEVIRLELFRTDERINEAEQRLRRELVVHASVHGIGSMPAALLFMSIVKDAERIGDYAKNIFDLRVEAPPLERNDLHADLVSLKTRIADLMAETNEVFDSQDADEARALTKVLSSVEDHCDERVTHLLGCQDQVASPATLVLTYRYFKRVVSHCLNVATSVYMPLDKIDYLDERPRPPLPGEEPNPSA